MNMNSPFEKADWIHFLLFENTTGEKQRNFLERILRVLRPTTMASGEVRRRADTVVPSRETIFLQLFPDDFILTKACRRANTIIRDYFSPVFPDNFILIKNEQNIFRRGLMCFVNDIYHEQVIHAHVNFHLLRDHTTHGSFRQKENRKK